MFGFWRSAASFRVRMAFNETMIDLDTGEQTAPAFAAMNPQAQVPLVTFENGVRLTQSVATLEYLDETHPTPRLLPRNPAGHAMVRALAGI